MRWRQAPDGAVRLENSLVARFSVTTLLVAATAAVAALLVSRRWVDDTALVVAAVITVVLVAIFASPEALVVSEEEVRDESGWRRHGWRILRSEVTAVVWEGDHDFFEPPQLTFRGLDGEVLLRTPVEFDRQEVHAALLAKGWPLETR
jgi:hypothetical protein